jgi:hypothetical protein
MDIEQVDERRATQKWETRNTKTPPRISRCSHTFSGRLRVIELDMVLEYVINSFQSTERGANLAV